MLNDIEFWKVVCTHKDWEGAVSCAVAMSINLDKKHRVTKWEGKNFPWIVWERKHATLSEVSVG